jgi:drug/metabolite transporter (DMT)-like permease
MLWITAAFGACFLGVRWGLRDAPLLWFAALRALLAGAALAVVAHVQRRRWPRSATAWGGLGVLGLVNVSLAFAAMFAGIAGLATGTAAVLANAQPLLIVLPAWLLYRERLTRRTGIALVVGFGGLLVVAVPGGGGQGALLSLLAAVAVTAGTLMVRRLSGVDVVVASAVHLLLGGAVLAVAAAVVEGPPTIDWTPRFVAVLAFLGLIGTAATTLAWFVETQRRPLSSLTPWMFLVPVFGLLIGIVVLGERPNAWTVTGIALVLLSMRVALTGHGIAGAGPGHLHAVDSHSAKTRVAEKQR